MESRNISKLIYCGIPILYDNIFCDNIIINKLKQESTLIFDPNYNEHLDEKYYVLINEKDLLDIDEVYSESSIYLKYLNDFVRNTNNKNLTPILAIIGDKSIKSISVVYHPEYISYQQFYNFFKNPKNLQPGEVFSLSIQDYYNLCKIFSQVIITLFQLKEYNIECQYNINLEFLYLRKSNSENINYFFPNKKCNISINSEYIVNITNISEKNNDVNYILRFLMSIFEYIYSFENELFVNKYEYFFLKIYHFLTNPEKGFNISIKDTIKDNLKNYENYEINNHFFDFFIQELLNLDSEIINIDIDNS